MNACARLNECAGISGASLLTVLAQATSMAEEFLFFLFLGGRDDGMGKQ